MEINKSTVNTNTRIHDFLKDKLNKEMISVDLTCGNGYDTLFLAQYTQSVYSFDIQEIALTRAKELTKDYKNITFILDDHQNVSNYIPSIVHCCIINCGYLPNGDKSITTQSQSTIFTLTQILHHLATNGYLIITVYPGHFSGKIEAEMVKHFIEQQSDLETLSFVYPKENTPIGYICIKKKKRV